MSENLNELEQVTEPLMLDSTGKEIAKAIEGLYIGKRVLININNVGWGTVTGGGAYTSGSPVTLTAIPETGCGFLAWKDASGNILGTDRTYTFTILNDTIIQAIFIDDEVTEIVPWSTGDIEKIQLMVAAANAGIIELSDYWSVGDTRTISHSAMENGGVVKETHIAQEVEWVIMDFTCKGFKLTSDTTKTPLAIIGMKNCLKEKGNIKPTASSAGGWAESERRTWCNDILRESFPSAEKALFKQFTWKLCGGRGASPVLTETNDYFALFPEKTIGGACVHSAPEEALLFDQFEWYLTVEHRIKTVNGTASIWWESSPSKSRGDMFFFVSSQGECVASDGVHFYTFPNDNHGISAFGCI